MTNYILIALSWPSWVVIVGIVVLVLWVLCGDMLNYAFVQQQTTWGRVTEKTSQWQEEETSCFSDGGTLDTPARTCYTLWILAEDTWATRATVSEAEYGRIGKGEKIRFAYRKGRFDKQPRVDKVLV